jgi:hypothetical protein
MRHAVILASALTIGLAISPWAAARTASAAFTGAPSQTQAPTDGSPAQAGQAPQSLPPSPGAPSRQDGSPAPAAPPRGQAQTPGAGATGDHPDYSGTWKLDPSISADPSKTTFDPPQNPNAQRFGGFGGGRRGGGGGRRPGRDTANDGTPDERARRQALVDFIRKGAATLVISHHDPHFVINDAADHTQFLESDDSTANQQIGTQTISAATHWEGPHLVSEYTLSSRQKLVFTYTLLAASKQMVLRVRLDDTERRRVLAQELKFVYTLVPAAAK